MAPSKRGRSKTLGAGDSRQGGKYLQNGTEARMTLLPVRDHKEPGKSTTHRAPDSSRRQGFNTDQNKTKNHHQADSRALALRPVAPQPQTEARVTMLPVRSHKEPGQTTHRTGESEQARRPSTHTKKTRARSNSDSRALATHGKPSKPAVAQTEARMTMMPVRPHKDTTRRVPRGSEAPSKSKGFSLFGGHGTTNPKTNATFNNKPELDTRQPVTRHNTNGTGKSQANKKSLWQLLVSTQIIPTACSHNKTEPSSDNWWRIAPPTRSLVW